MAWCVSGAALMLLAQSHLQFEGVIDREVASRLRENVYYLQMALGE